jgi:hypothetical protein
MFILITSCSQDQGINQEIEAYLEEGPISERTYFQNEKYTEYFQEMYMLEDLISHEAYVVENNVNFTFYFHQELTPSQVKSIDGFFTQIAFKDIPPIGGPIYGKEIYDMKPIDSMTYRIFVDDNLLQYKSYDFDTNREDYYENMTLDVSRPLKDDNAEAYVESLENTSLFIKNVEINKPYRGYVIYFDFDTYFSLNDQEIEAIKEIIENEIAPALEENDMEKYGMNTSAIGIVLNFEHDKNEQLSYFNGQEKKWLYENWQNYDFFTENLK